MPRWIVCAVILTVTSNLFVTTAAQKAKSSPSSEYRVSFYYESTEELSPEDQSWARGMWTMEDDMNTMRKKGYEVFSIAGVTGDRGAQNKTSRLTHFVVVYRLRRPESAASGSAPSPSDGPATAQPPAPAKEKPPSQ